MQRSFDRFGRISGLGLRVWHFPLRVAGSLLSFGVGGTGCSATSSSSATSRGSCRRPLLLRPLHGRGSSATSCLSATSRAVLLDDLFSFGHFEEAGASTTSSLSATSRRCQPWHCPAACRRRGCSRLGQVLRRPKLPRGPTFFFLGGCTGCVSTVVRPPPFVHACYHASHSPDTSLRDPGSHGLRGCVCLSWRVHVRRREAEVRS